MSMTNAQAALQAAATVFSGGRGHTAPADVKGMAASFKNWLDHQDKEQEKSEEVSHHITCASRRSSNCTCSPLPYDAQLKLWEARVQRQDSEASQLVQFYARGMGDALLVLEQNYKGCFWSGVMPVKPDQPRQP